MNDEIVKEKFPLLLTIVLITGIFLVGSDELIISPLLPLLVHDFNTSFSLAALSVSLYGLAIGLVVLFIAPFIDRISRRKLMGLSLMGFAVSSMICAAAPNISILLIGRLLSGVFAGVYIPTVYAYVGDQVSFTFRGRVMGLVLSGWSLSLIIGIPLGAYMGDLIHWRWTFILIGSLAVGVSLISLNSLYGESKLIQTVSSNKNFIGHLYMACKAKEVGILIFVTFCNMFGFYGLYTFLGSYIQETYSLSTSDSGKVILFYGIGIALSPLAGVIVDYLGKKVTLISALIGLTINLIALSVFKLSLFQLYGLLIAWGALQSLVLTSLSSLLSEQSQEYRGRVMSLYSLATNLAVAMGSWTMGFVYHSYGFDKIGIICGLISGIGAIVYMLVQLYNKHYLNRKQGVYSQIKGNSQTFKKIW
ncbi:MAG TPA: MFS transporter [Pseudoneobacillus sp.]|nr:MFS transporter [Pseudoneobacillus sp.]